MRNLPAQRDPDLLIGAELFSDAGVYRLTDSLAIVQSVDFFAPIVDDPYTFGRIAAANALSDLYACAAAPKTALNLVGFPIKELELSVLSEILAGGAERVNAAGAVIVGGHSVRDAEVKYGLAVTGVVDPAKMLTNRGAHAGDAIILTKGIGTGFITTAARNGACAPGALESACESMTMLNAAGAQAASEVGAHAATDVTGFGLAVHAAELAEASGVTIEIDLGRVPLLPGAIGLATPDFFTSANANNRASLEGRWRLDGSPDAALAEMLFDPQTSGGLLISAPRSRAPELVDRCRLGGLTMSAILGDVTPRREVSIVVRG